MKTESKEPGLMKRMREFLTSYLPVVKKKSPHTVTAYRDALNVYMAFLQSEKGIKFRDVTANGFCRDNIVSFMEWLRSARGNEVTTVNQRLSHIRSFCKYMTKNDVLSVAGYEEIRDISDYKDTRTPDFVANKNGEADLHIFGKGNKHRCTPISSDINPYYKEYCAIYPPDLDLEKEELLFYTDRKGIRAQMSDDCVAKFLKKYEGSARNINPEIPHQHPHLWRRTRAMHLYLAGVPLPLVSEWLGHSDEVTTRVYARAADEMKRQAQRKQ